MSTLILAQLLLAVSASAPLPAGAKRASEKFPVNTSVPEPVFAPVEDVRPGPKAGAQAPQGGDLAVFRNNASDKPELSAAALLRLFGAMSGEELSVFRGKYCGKIVEMLTALETNSAAGRVTPAAYARLAEQFEPFNIPLISGYKPEEGGMRKSSETKDPVLALVKTRSTMNTGDVKKSETAIAEVARTYPENPSVQSAAAAYFAELRNFAMAEKTATDAIELDENSPDAYKTRAFARASLEDRKGAIADIQKAVAIDPQDESARVLSVLLESRKPVPTLKTVSSLQAMKRSLGIADDSHDAVAGGDPGPGEDEPGLPLPAASPDLARSKTYLKTALAKNRLGDYESAANYATLAIEKDPGNLEAYLERANASNFLGRYEDAVRDTSLVIEKDPRNMQAFNMRAWALNRNGKARDAETDASRAIGLNPNFADAWFNRALAYEKQGNYKSMLEDFRQAAALSGSYSSRYQDAVAQYGPRVPGFVASGGGGAAYLGEEVSAPAASGRTPLQRFMLLLVFTLTGGGLVAMGLVHIATEKKDRGPAPSRSTHPDVLSPSVYYEGVATGKYKIEKKVGEGGMGQVYQAVDQSLGRKVAIKKMNEEIKVNDREKQRFLDEARTVALLHHPNIVEIYTIFEEDNDIYLVFEYVEGRGLDNVLDTEARINFPRVRGIFDETAKALAYAHAKGVVHRDLKLSNIMLSEEDGVKVMDFGLARRARESKALASNKEIVGSPAYMAPEQELGVSTVESDIYSLGVCLYESLSGVLPFAGPDFHQQKTRKACQPLSAMVPGLPAGVDALVDKCLAPDPEKRFRSVEEFRSALNAIA